MLAAGTATLALGILTAIPVAANNSGTVNGTIPVTVPAKAITVSPSSFSYNCTGPTSPNLSFPNGTCSESTIFVTNSGSANANIDVMGSNAMPADGLTPWTLCQGTSPAPAGAAAVCTGSGTSPAILPGSNQYWSCTGTANPATGITTPTTCQGATQTQITSLANTSQCDVAFDLGRTTGGNSTAGCASSAGQAAFEELLVTGPSVSTDTSNSFSSFYTWTAM